MLEIHLFPIHVHLRKPAGSARPDEPRPRPDVERLQPTSSTPPPEESLERHHRTWLVPLLVVANVVVFLAVMFYNNCPRNGGGDCVGRGFLRRVSFQPLKENPLLGPSATT